MHDERRRGPGMVGPMQAAFAKANVLVVKETSGSPQVTSEGSYGRRHDDRIVQDQIEYARAMMQSDNEEDSQIDNQETKMQTQTGRTHTLTPKAPPEIPAGKLPNMRRRIYDFMATSKEKGFVLSISEITKALSQEGYKDTTLTVTANQMAREGFFEVPEGYITAKPLKYQLKDGVQKPTSETLYSPTKSYNKSGKKPTGAVTNSAPSEVAKLTTKLETAQQPQVQETQKASESAVVPAKGKLEELFQPKESSQESSEKVFKASIIKLREEKGVALVDILLDTLSVKEAIMLISKMKVLKDL